MVNVNGYSLRVEAVRENRVEAVRIRDHHARGEEGPRGGTARAAEQPPTEVERSEQ
jgi:hypothetical protein